MCIICLKPAGVEMPSEKEIKHMFQRNPHGAGFAIQGDIHNDGRFLVEYHKGFMNVDDLLEALGPRDKLKDLTVAIHCRIKTSGETDKFTTHPFPISNQYSDLRETDGSGAVLFHNGVFSGLGGVVNEKSSDTQDFVIGVASRYLKNARMPGKISQTIVGKIVDDCRVLILYPKKNFPLLRWGKWYEHNGCWYSNMGYLDESYKYSSNYHYSSSYSTKKSSYREEIDEWGCNVAEYAWPSEDDDWIRFDHGRWQNLMSAVKSKREVDDKTIATFSVTGVKEWIVDEEREQIYTQNREEDVKLRNDEEDYMQELEMDGMGYMDKGYIWFGDDSVMLDWMDRAKQIAPYEYEFNKQKWYVDVVNYEAFTEEGIKDYFTTGEQGHAKRQISSQGCYLKHNKNVVFDDDYNYWDDEYEEELETLRKEYRKENK